MKYYPPKPPKPQFKNSQLWESLDSSQSQSISGGGPLLFANPFAYIPAQATSSLSGRLGIGG